MKEVLAREKGRVCLLMRVIGNHRAQTIARTALLATLLLANTAVTNAQNPTGTGVQPPSNEELIERASKSSVKADAIWIEITKVGKEASRWVMDLRIDSVCLRLTVNVSSENQKSLSP